MSSSNLHLLTLTVLLITINLLTISAQNSGNVTLGRISKPSLDSNSSLSEPEPSVEPKPEPEPEPEPEAEPEPEGEPEGGHIEPPFSEPEPEWNVAIDIWGVGWQCQYACAPCFYWFYREHTYLLPDVNWSDFNSDWDGETAGSIRRNESQKGDFPLHHIRRYSQESASHHSKQYKTPMLKADHGKLHFTSDSGSEQQLSGSAENRAFYNINNSSSNAEDEEATLKIVRELPDQSERINLLASDSLNSSTRASREKVSSTAGSRGKVSSTAGSTEEVSSTAGSREKIIPLDLNNSLSRTGSHPSLVSQLSAEQDSDSSCSNTEYSRMLADV